MDRFQLDKGMIVRQDEQVDELLFREELTESLEGTIVGGGAPCNKEISARLRAEQITPYKSLGFASEDLCVAELVWKMHQNQQDGSE